MLSRIPIIRSADLHSVSHESATNGVAFLCRCVGSWGLLACEAVEGNLQANMDCCIHPAMWLRNDVSVRVWGRLPAAAC